MLTSTLSLHASSTSRQGRHPLVGKLGPEPAADIESLEVLQARLPDLRAVVGHLHEVAVVRDDHDTIDGLLDIDLHEVRTVGDGPLDGGHGVLGRGS